MAAVRYCSSEKYYERYQVLDSHKMFGVHIWLPRVGPSWNQGPEIGKLEDINKVMDILW